MHEEDPEGEEQTHPTCLDEDSITYTAGNLNVDCVDITGTQDDSPILQ
jgi:hypothetical protein